MSFDKFLNISLEHLKNSQNSQEFNKRAEALNKGEIWNALIQRWAEIFPQESQPSNASESQPSNVSESQPSNISEMIDRFREKVANEAETLYGGPHCAEGRALALTEFAQVLALHQGRANYHTYLLGENIPAESAAYEELWKMPHQELCLIRNEKKSPDDKTRPFDIIPYAELMADLKANGELRNHYTNQSIDPTNTIMPSEKYSKIYCDYRKRNGGKITSAIYFAFQNFIEKVYSHQAAAATDINPSNSMSLNSRLKRNREAFLDLHTFLKSLPQEDQDTLDTLMLSGEEKGETFKQIYNRALQADYCLAQFSSKLISTLKEFKGDLKLNNKEAMSLAQKEKVENNVDKGEIKDTAKDDLIFLNNLHTCILNTKFDVFIGTSISFEGEKNSVPSHVAKAFKLCEKAIKGEMNASQARFEAVALCARCYRHPHNSPIAFLNTRKESTHNFYGVVADPKGSSILEERSNAFKTAKKDEKGADSKSFKQQYEDQTKIPKEKDKPVPPSIGGP
jgi:hypothetical protein